MRLSPLLAGLLVSAMLLSGCFGGDEDPEPTTSTSTTSSTTTSTSSSSTTTSSSSTSTTPPPPPANKPPTGSISAVVNGTVATFTLTGTDQDGDALTWALAFGDGSDEEGSTLPATVNHTYAAAGNFSVVYTLSDGKDNATYNVTVTAVAGSGSTGPLQVVTGSYATGTPVDCLYGYLEPLAGVTYVTFDVEPSTQGMPFVADFTVTLPALALLVDFFDGAGEYLGTETFPPTPEPGATQNSGTVPVGAVSGFLSSCGGGQVSVTYTAG